MTRLILMEDTQGTPVARLLDALGTVFERRTLTETLSSPEDARDTALILSEEQLVNAHGRLGSRLKELVCRYRHALLYPFRGTAQGLRALSDCVGGRANAEPLDGGDEASYFVSTRFPAAGAFGGLQISPASATTDFRVRIHESRHPIEHIVSVGDGGLFIRIAFPSSELFVTSSTAVFDVEAEVDANLAASTCFSALVPFLFFLHHCQAAFWQSSCRGANWIIDDVNLRPRYGFIDTRALAAHVDELGSAVSIAFIPWNCDRTSPEIVDLFRARWPRLSLCIHGCDHVGAEFVTRSLAHALSMLAASLDRMRTLKANTGLPHDRVMVFPQGKFSRTAMDALRQSDFLAAVNTELVDDRTGRGVRAAELLRPAITSYGGFPLFLRRKIREPIANFALDLLLGKPCLVVTHHDDFRDGMQPFVSLVRSLNALAADLEWTNLETIVSRTYLTRTRGTSVDIRLLAASTTLQPTAADGTVGFSKAEPLVDKPFAVSIAGQRVDSHWQDGTLTFQRAIGSDLAHIDVTILRPERTPPALRPLRYRAKVTARRYLSEIRDNYVSTSPWAAAAVKSIRRGH